VEAGKEGSGGEGVGAAVVWLVVRLSERLAWNEQVECVRARD
jgi:hypothetical protein